VIIKTQTKKKKKKQTKQKKKKKKKMMMMMKKKKKWRKKKQETETKKEKRKKENIFNFLFQRCVVLFLMKIIDLFFLLPFPLFLISYSLFFTVSSFSFL
jgi:actin-related protein